MGCFANVAAVTAFVVLGVISFLSAWTNAKIFRKLIFRTQIERYDDDRKLYRDEDGVATEETQKKFSAAIPKYIALAGSFAGFSLSAVASIHSTLHSAECMHIESWITSACWLLLVIDIAYICAIHNPVERCEYGILDALALTAISVAICVRMGVYVSGSAKGPRRSFLVLDILQLASALISCLACLSLPRRPDLVDGSRPVDGRYTVSVIGASTFTWAGDLLTLARTKRTLDLVELPRLHFQGRSAYLHNHFASLKTRRQLWKSLLLVHYPELTFQTIFITFQAVVQFLPQLTMYQLLKLLEQRSYGIFNERAAWGLVCALGASIIISSWSLTWVHWIVWARLGQPIRTELSAMIFTKATRRKDIKGVRNIQESNLDDADEQNNPKLKEPITVEDDIDRPTDDVGDAAEDVQKTRQSTINLVGVDAKRISDFFTFYYFFPKTVVDLTVSLAFIIKLIGWKSLLAGLSVFVIVLPLNLFTSKRYSDTQGNLMKLRDQKMVVVTEALQGIRQIKFSAQEEQWEEKIGRKRRQELKTQWRVFCLNVCLIAIWILGPVMLSAISLAVYAVLNGELSASIAFTTIYVMSSLETSFAVLPELIADGLEAWVSVQRIDEYLDSEEVPGYLISGNAVAFENATVAWPSESKEDDHSHFQLKNINVQFPNQELSIISGKTGSGKSLLLAAILGEAEKLAGSIEVPKAPAAESRFDYKANESNWIIEPAIAFVAQTPWIENASIRNNILFGLPFDPSRYKKVISCCALEKDLDILPDGEMTDIGANGINLSGGQRWRISFARSLYSRAGILVLDDIFSAVDAHVGRQLFERALTGELGEGRTRILVTHHTGLCLPRAKYTVILGEGTVQHAGFVEDLRHSGVLDEVMKQKPYKAREVVDNDRKQIDEPDNATNGSLRKIVSLTSKVDNSELNFQDKSKPKQFTEDEKRETGAIKARIYKEYLGTSGGFWFWLPILLLFVVYQGIILGRSWFIGLWTRSYNSSFLVEQSLTYSHAVLSKIVNPMKSQHQGSNDLSFYLDVYLGLSVLICILGTLRYFLVYLGSIRASKGLFDRLTYAVLRAPLRWLDITPVGRILNRFTADFAAIDSRLGNDLGFLLYQIVQLIGIIVAGLFVSVWMLLIALILFAVCSWITARFLVGAREIKRLESNAKSPIFEQFGTALVGIGTIRAYDKVDVYVERMFENIDAHARAFWYLWLFNRWVAFRLNVIGAGFAILVAAVIVFSGIDASLAGFALSFALQYSNALLWTARCYANVELALNSVERVFEYSKIPTEKQEATINVPAAWPTKGQIEVSNLVAGYASDLPPVLKGLSFAVERNQRIGVVGRTGAGKSSLTLALFRFLEASEGSICIDGIDVSKISLHDLRSRVAIIPQDPVLFSGTLRSNLDAFDEHTNSELYDALERVHLAQSTGTSSRDEHLVPSGPAEGSSSTAAVPATDVNINVFASLSSRISEGGLNLSQGQRQLLCLARAIVSRPKIMVLDEATSAVDMATDVLIQRSIREDFRDSTLLVIAHRLSTIADFDRILVMEDGRAVEFDSPRALLAKKEKGSVFKGMVEQSGEKDKLREIILGSGSSSREGGGEEVS